MIEEKDVFENRLQKASDRSAFRGLETNLTPGAMKNETSKPINNEVKK